MAGNAETATWLDGQFKVHPANVDLAWFRLDVEARLSADVDGLRCKAMLNALGDDLRYRVPTHAASAARLSALRDFLYRAGPWNRHQPIRYDLQHALDNDVRHGFLSKLLKTRLGNCVSMPLLFVALGRRLGLPLTLAVAPGHVMGVYVDPSTGREVLLETTSGAQPIQIESIRRDLPMTDEAIASGVYLRGLSDRESMGLLAMPLLQTALSQKDDRLVIELADVVLNHAPRNVDALISKGSAFAIRMKRDFEKHYPNPASMPTAVRAAYERAHRDNRRWFKQAEALGWRDPDSQAEARYKQRIQQLRKPASPRTPP